MKKRLTAMLLVGLMLTQSPFAAMAETLQAEGELAAGEIVVDEAAETAAPAQAAESEVPEIAEELPAADISAATIPAEGTAAEAVVSEVLPEEISAGSEENAAAAEELILPEEEANELAEEISAPAGESSEELTLQEEPEEEITESLDAESLFPEEEAHEEETVEEETDLTGEVNPTRQAADDFFRAASAILSTMTPGDGSPNLAGTTQLTKDTVSKTLKDKIIAGARRDSEGNYYLLSATTVEGVTVKYRIYYLAAYNEFLFETEFNTVVEGVTYKATINMSVPFGNTSDAEISYFLDNVATKENYLIARSVIAKPSTYTGTENLTFEVEGLNDDLFDYEVDELANTTLKSSFGTWNTLLLNKAKVSMCTLGFDSFIMSHKHSYSGKVINRASRVQDGRFREICSGCGDIKTNLTVPQISSFALNYYKIGYTGTVQRPYFIIKDRTGAVISSKYYDITYSNVNSRSIGTYSATVTLKDRYFGSRTLSYSIVKQSEAPAAPKLSQAENNYAGIGIYFFPVSKASLYYIYRKENDRWRCIKSLAPGDPLLVSTPTRLYYKDTTVVNNYGAHYVYSVAVKVGTQISAFDTNGIDVVRLRQPTIAKITKLSATQAKVVWKAEDCEGYQLQYKEDGGSWLTCSNTTKTARYVGNLKKGKKYTFRLRSYRTSNRMGRYYSIYSKNYTFTMP